MMPVLLRYTRSLIAQMADAAACNGHGTLEQRLCRWLLLSLDRSAGSELVLTQELIAHMLGVRREGVTEAAGRLQHLGVIRYHRGHISVLDRPALERRVCECYSAPGTKPGGGCRPEPARAPARRGRARSARRARFCRRRSAG